MNRVVKTLARTGSTVAVAVYRWSGGRIGGRLRGTPVLLLTVPGRRSGRPRTTAVGYFEHAGGYVVTGTAGGAPRDPDWFQNLRRAPEANVQVGTRTFRAQVRELHGAERDAVWRDVIVATAPLFAPYANKAGRTIPVAVLTPLPAA